MTRWMQVGKGVVDFAPVQSGAGEPFGLRADQPMGALHLIEVTGEKRRGAEAVFRMMDLCSSTLGKPSWWFYRWCLPFRALSDRCYGWVAVRRGSLSKIACRIPEKPKTH